MKIAVFLLLKVVKIIFHFFRLLRVITLQEMKNVPLDFIFLHVIKLITVLLHFRIEVGITEEEKCMKVKE